jgi:hypothetical protein
VVNERKQLDVRRRGSVGEVADAVVEGLWVSAPAAKRELHS